MKEKKKHPCLRRRIYWGLGLSGLLIVGSLLFTTYQSIQQQKQTLLNEQQRLAHLDVEKLELPFLINTVDEIGGADLQYHWKELVAIASVQTRNYPDQITEEQLTDVAKQFHGKNGIQSFETVVKTQLQNVPEELSAEDGYKKKERREREKERQQIIQANTEFETLAHQYLEDLTYAGYTPEKLVPEAKETQFIEQVKPGAIENYQRYGILPSITIAQAILESNWGQSQLAQEGKNLFGVKVGYDWTGDVITLDTREFYDTWIQDDFRKYQDVTNSILDHGKFLVENPRYTEAGVFKRQTYRQQAQALQNAGYSTDQNEAGEYVYAEKLGALIRQYNLQLIDHEVLHPDY